MIRSKYSILVFSVGVSILLSVVAFSMINDNEFLISEYKQIITYDPQELSFGLYSKHMSSIRTPAPMELSSLGKSFELFLTSDKNTPISSLTTAMPYSTSIEQSELEKLQDAGLIMIPSFIPDGLEIKKAIYRNDGITSVKLILLPQTVDKEIVTTSDDIFDYNGIYILISKFDYAFESDEEFEKWRDGMIGDHGDKIKKIEVNGWKGLAGYGEPQKGELSTISLTSSYNKIQLRSTTYDVSYLKQIAESMLR